MFDDISSREESVIPHEPMSGSTTKQALIINAMEELEKTVDSIENQILALSEKYDRPKVEKAELDKSLGEFLNGLPTIIYRLNHQLKKCEGNLWDALNISEW
jgi:exonuclease VII small subunit